MEVTLGSVGAEIFVGSVDTDEVDFVVICEDLGLVEVTVGSVDTDEVDFVVICEDLCLVEVTLGSVGTEVFVS